MARTDWNQIVSGKQLMTVKNTRKKIFVSQKIASKDLPKFIDSGWEKSKDFKNSKFVGIIKEKSIAEQFEDYVWSLLANMGFTELNSGKDFLMAFDFQDDSLLEPISAIAVDERPFL